MTTRERGVLGACVGVIAGFLVRDLDLPTLMSFWGDRVFLLPAGALVGAACGATRLRRPFYAATLVLAGLWLAVAYTPLSGWLLTGLVRSDALRPADAILVLSSRVQTDGDPSATQLARLFRGLELMEDGLAPRLIITEMASPYPQQAPFVRSMLNRFRPEAELVILGPVRNTRDESVACIQYLKQHGLKSLIVTSSPTHTRRAAALFEAQGLNVMATPAVETQFDLQVLDRPNERLAAFGSIMHERLGLLVYRWRGWIR